MSSPALNPSDSVEPRVQQGDEVVATTAQSETVLMDNQIPVAAEVEIAFDQTVPSGKTALASTGHYPADSSSSSNARQLDSSGDLSTSCELDQSSGGYVAGDEATDSGSEVSSFDISSLDVSMSSTSGPGADESSTRGSNVSNDLPKLQEPTRSLPILPLPVLSPVNGHTSSVL